MGTQWEHSDQTKTPTPELVKAYVNDPLWDGLCDYLEQQYQIKPCFEFSRCSFAPGWNVKYKKAGRGLCTLYPVEGGFTVLVVIGEREKEEVELLMPTFTEYLQQLYQQTKAGMGQKWLMIQVQDQAVLEDVKRCIAVRRNVKKPQK